MMVQLTPTLGTRMTARIYPSYLGRLCSLIQGSSHYSLPGAERMLEMLGLAFAKECQVSVVVAQIYYISESRNKGDNKEK